MAAALVVAGLLGSGAARPQGAAVSERASSPQIRSGSEPGSRSVVREVATYLRSHSARSETCRSAKNAVRFYESRWRYWRTRMGAGKDVARSALGQGCPHVRLLAKHARARAHAARLSYLAWWHEQYAWWDWMPAFWRAIAMCEEHLDFTHRAGSYTSAFAISIAEYDHDAAYMGAPPWFTRHTPRDQYRAALGHQARFGLSGWGCYTNGGYRSHMP